MKKFIRSIITKVLLYAFAPERGQPGVRLMTFSDGGFLISLSNQDGRSIASVKLMSDSIEFVTEKDVKVIVDGSVLTEVGKSHWSITKNILAINAEVISHQDGKTREMLRDVSSIDESLKRRAAEMESNAQRLQDNMESEQCHLDHDHASNLSN